MNSLTVTVVGLGLIGGSVARALKSSVKAIYGVDCDNSVLNFAREQNIIDDGYTNAKVPLGKSDIVILCLYPNASLNFVKDNINNFKDNSILTDVVGVKSPLMKLYNETKPNFIYIGGHPMAGREVSGFINSTDTMFNGANFIITPPNDATEEQIKVVESLAMTIGCATITRTTTENHDKIIAYTSQLPHVIATAMCDTPLLVKHKNFTGGSFEDVTRVAKINELLWTELFLNNSEYLIEEIDRFTNSLNDIKTAIKCGDNSKLMEIMRRVRLDKELIDNA